MNSNLPVKIDKYAFGDVLISNSNKLKSAGISSADLDVLILLEDQSGKDRGWLMAHPEFELSSAIINKLNKQISRRIKHEPLAYIRNRCDFYGRQFYIDSRVLQPRPESEAMIALLRDVVADKKLKDVRNPVIADIGTGSGALAVTAKLEMPQLSVVATDIDVLCLEVARKNAKSHKVSIEFFQGDLQIPLTANSCLPFAILANLPYVPDKFKLNDAAMHEPKLAIYGGPDGLDVYRRLFVQLSRLKNKPSYVLTESLPIQHEKLVKIAAAASYTLIKTENLIQAFQKIISN